MYKMGHGFEASWLVQLKKKNKNVTNSNGYFSAF